MTTRLIGALIMVHGDDSGLVLPPKIAPVQMVIIPVQQHVEGVLEKARELKERLSKVCRVTLDDSDKMPGWKFSEHEMRVFRCGWRLVQRTLRRTRLFL